MRADDLYRNACISCKCQLNNAGMAEDRSYGIYHNMKYRCNNPNCEMYKNYGGNGMYYGIDPQNNYYEFENANSFAREHQLNGNNIRQVAYKEKKTHNGWTFGFVNEKNE